ncbi:hypothetical protein F442_09442 [Phytophthora nicotianae P10297]|uniref:Uncharacterized protein n=4 Tax=Phytophthora nicotianae TaxID=4792 RepID=W2Z948_PHYNI|nr:hypothetical protein L916_09233 [Phytophthora nicotianae]ETL92560.1 hypothetical protein L917_09166 [Phytophthora nicotianae]ETP43897.1 hypothetical protein F442_09442 [Phytophthora nicotianae P10297]
MYIAEYLGHNKYSTAREVRLLRNFGPLNTIYA